jgi:hypothetical protein
MPHFGWRPIFWVLAIGIGLATAAIGWLSPAWNAAAPAGTHAPASYSQVWSHAYFRRLTPIGFLNYGGMIAIQSLWAGPWLVRVAGYPPADAARGLFLINVCMLATFWTWGMLNPSLQRRGLTTDKLITRGVPVSLLMLAGIVVAGPAAGAWAWALFCVTSTFVSLAQPAIGMAFPPHLAGRALSAYNLVIFAGVFVIQWGIGLLVDGALALGWDQVAAFRVAMGVFLACCLLGYGWFVWPNDNHRQ